MKLLVSTGLDVRRVDLDADGLTDQIHGEHEPRVRALAHQTADHALERTAHHLGDHALTNEGARVVLQIALDESTDAVDLVLGNRCNLAVERDDADDAAALEDGEPLIRLEAREAVARKQRPVDLLLAVLPAAPARDRRQKGFDALLHDLIADDLLVP